MTRDAANTNDIASRILAFFSGTEEYPVPPEVLMNALAELRANGPENGGALAHLLTDVIERQGQALTSVQEIHEQLREVVTKLTAPPYFPAAFLGAADSGSMAGALVQTESDRRIVGVGDGVAIEELLPGDEVILSHERNCLIGKSAAPSSLTGEIAVYSRTLGDGRMVIRARDEELVVLPSPALRSAMPKAGESVRYDRARGLAFERIEASRGEEYFLESTPRDSFEEIGGLDREIETLKRTLTLHMFNRETATRYKLAPKKAVLMEGPPGNGKTKVARATCAWLASLSQSGRSFFINVKPGALNSMWFGQTEHHYRDIFKVAREAAQLHSDTPVVMFWDEIDAVGGVRGESVHRIDDRILNVFMSELNGLEDRGNIVILAATNRRDALDPALVRPGRLGDLVLYFPPPNRRAARAILACHLPAEIPYAADGDGPAAARDRLLDLAVGQIFAQSPETELARLTLRDGKQRLVRASDLVSGALLAAIAQTAIERACVREVEGGPAGVTISDLDAAITESFRVAARGLTPRNARNYLRDLPQDIDVVRVDLVENKVIQPHRYRVEAA